MFPFASALLAWPPGELYGAFPKAGEIQAGWEGGLVINTPQCQSL